MKKLILLAIVLLTLTGCGPTDNNAISNSEGTSGTVSKQEIKNGISLTLDNFGDYVAINTISSLADPSNDSLIYYSYFIGADNCRFYDCTVKYIYVSGSNEYSGTTISLTISGDGQAEPFFIRNNGRTAYKLVVTSVSGTVVVGK